MTVYRCSCSINSLPGIVFVITNRCRLGLFKVRWSHVFLFIHQRVWNIVLPWFQHRVWRIMVLSIGECGRWWRTRTGFIFSLEMTFELKKKKSGDWHWSWYAQHNCFIHPPELIQSPPAFPFDACSYTKSFLAWYHGAECGFCEHAWERWISNGNSIVCHPFPWICKISKYGVRRAAWRDAST